MAIHWGGRGPGHCGRYTPASAVAAPSAPAPAIISSTAWVYNSGSGNLAVPDVQSGDLLLLAVGTFYTEAISTPSGFTARNVVTGNGPRLSLFERESDGTETEIAYSDSGSWQMLQLYVIRGCTRPGGSAIHKVGSNQAQAAGDGTYTLPGFTTEMGNCLIMGMTEQHNGSFDGGAWSHPDISVTKLTTRVQGDQVYHHAHGVKEAAGLVGSMTGHLSANFWFAGFQAAIR